MGLGLGLGLGVEVEGDPAHKDAIQMAKMADEMGDVWERYQVT